jgi:hypothetical protein
MVGVTGGLERCATWRVVGLRCEGWLPHGAGFVAGVLDLETGVADAAAHRPFVRAGCPGAQRPPLTQYGCGPWLGLGRGGGSREEARELARTCRVRDVWVLATLAHAAVHALEAVLRAPGDLQDVVRQALLAIRQRDADPWLARVVPGCLNEQPPGVL